MAIDTVRYAFPSCVVEHEGRTSWMYRDTHVDGLVTCGVGNLVDPVRLAIELPWRRPSDGSLATETEVRLDWQRVKDLPRAMRAEKYKSPSGLYLAEIDIDMLVARRFDEFMVTLSGYFPDMPLWPPDARMGIALMAWALGPHFPRRGWPKFAEACLKRDWRTAERECVMPKARPERNEAHQLCFANARRSTDTLFYPEAAPEAVVETDEECA